MELANPDWDQPPPIARPTFISKVPTDELGIATLYEGTKAEVDVVAVHGLGAIPEMSWKEKTSGVNWLKDAGMLPSAIPNARIMRFGYDSMYLSREPVRTSIDIIANHLLAELARERRDCDDRPLIFIAHCFGGLVVEKALVNDHLTMHQKSTGGLLDATTGIIFLGTPHSGTATFTSQGVPAEAILSVISKYTELGLEARVLSELERQSGALLEVSKQFLRLCPSPSQYPRVVNFFEMRPSKVGKQFGRRDSEEFVVDEASAMLGSHPSYGLPLDHFSLNKFASSHDGNYKAIKNQLEHLYSAALNRSRALADANKFVANANNPADRPPPTLRRLNDAPVDRISSCFVGRDLELELIARELDSHHPEKPSRFVIHGMPGLGKSQLVLQYASLSFALERYSHIFWVSATTIEKLIQGFANILDLVDHPDRHHPEQDVRLKSARLVLENPDQHGIVRHLLVLDNTTMGSVGFICDHLPRQGGRGAILITTRTASIAESVASAAGQQPPIFELQALTVKQSSELLLKRSGITGKLAPGMNTEVQNLVKQLGCLPLAVEQAGSYVKRSHIGINELGALYNKEGLGQAMSWTNKLNNYEEKSVLATFNVQLQKLHKISPDASQLLTALAFLDTEAIPLEILVLGAECVVATASKRDQSIFRRLGSSIWHKEKHPPSGHSSLLGLICSKERLREAIQHFEDLSLAKHQLQGDRPSLYIHDLIQFVLQQRAASEKTASRCYEYELIVRIFCNALQTLEDVESPKCWPECERYVSHLASLTGSNETWTTLNKELFDANISVARYFISRGRYSEAQALLSQVLERREKQPSFHDPQTLRAIHSLANAYSKQGRYQDAEPLYRKALSRQEKQLGVRHAETLTTMSDLARLHRMQGNYQKSEKMYSRALAGREKLFGADHRLTLAAVSGIAELYQNQGRYEEAQGLFLRAQTGSKKQLGAEHPFTLTTLHNLASLYEDQGKYEKAHELYKQALTGREEHLGVEHPDTLATVQNLALLYNHQGNYEVSAELYVRALAGFDQQLGSEHPVTLTTVQNLALLYNDQGKYDEAEKLYTRALAGREKQLGAEHPETLVTVHNLALLRNDQGKYKEAEELYTRALTGKEKKLGVEHPDTLITVKTLADLYETIDKYEESEELYKRALSGFEKRFGVEHPSTLVTAQNLLFLFNNQGRYEEAERLHARVLAGRG